MSEQMVMEIVLDAKARIEELKNAGVTIEEIKKTVNDAKIAFKEFTKSILSNSKEIVQRGFETIKKSAIIMSNAIKKSLKVIDQAFTRIVAITSIAGGTLIKLASDANEMENKFNVVFGNISKDVDKWATDYGNAINRSKNTIKDMLAENQNLLIGFGMNRESAAEFSKQIVMLTNDLSSFNNIDPKRTAELMISSLMGESMAAASLGASIKEAQLHLSAQELGLGKYSAKMDESTKMIIRFNAILRQSPDAIGDSVRTAWDFANVSKGIIDNLKFLGASIGKYLLPIATDYGKKLLTLIKSTSDWINTNKDAMKNIVETALSFLKFSSAIFIVIKALVLLTSPMTLVIAGIIAMKAAWDLNLFGIRDTAVNTWNEIRDKFQEFKDYLENADMADLLVDISVGVGQLLLAGGTVLTATGFLSLVKPMIMKALGGIGSAALVGTAIGIELSILLDPTINNLDDWKNVLKEIIREFQKSWETQDWFVIIEAFKNTLIEAVKEFIKESANLFVFTVTFGQFDLSGLEKVISEIKNRLEKMIPNWLENIGAGFTGGKHYIGQKREIDITGSKGYDSGGYTGDGGKYDVAGVVHRGEYVIPAWQVEKNPELVAQLEKERKKGYWTGGLAGIKSFIATNAKDEETSKEYLTTLENLESLINNLKKSVESLQNDRENLTGELKDLLEKDDDVKNGVNKEKIEADLNDLSSALSNTANVLNNEFLASLSSIVSNISGIQTSNGFLKQGGGLNTIVGGLGVASSVIGIADTVFGISSGQREYEQEKARREQEASQKFSNAVSKFKETIDNFDLGEKANSYLSTSIINFQKLTASDIKKYVSGSSDNESVSSTSLSAYIKQLYGVDINAGAIAEGFKNDHYKMSWYNWQYKKRYTGSSYDEAGIANEINKMIEEANKQLLSDFAQGIGLGASDFASNMLSALENSNFKETLENMYIDAQKKAYTNSSVLNAAYDTLSKKRTEQIAKEMSEWEKQYSNLNFENMSIEDIEKNILIISNNIAEQFDKVKGLAEILGEELGNDVSSALSSAFENMNFNNFSSSLGQIIYDTVKENLIDSFILTAQIKERLQEYSDLYAEGRKTEAIEVLKEVIIDAKEMYDTTIPILDDVKEEAKRSGVDFTSDSGSNNNSNVVLSETYYHPSVSEKIGIGGGTTVVNYHFDFTNANVYNEQMLEDKIKTTIKNAKEV